MNPREIDCWECGECTTHHFDIDDAEQCCMPSDETVVAQLKTGATCPACIRIHKDLRQVIALRLFSRCLSCSPILSYAQKEEFDKAVDDASC
jgi:hypothetical protein